MKNKVIIALIFVFSLLFVGNVYAENSVHIESVTLDSKSETISLAEAKYEGLSVNLDVKFGYVNEFAKFKIVINNPTNKKYELNLDGNNSGEYLTYSYEYDSNIINPKEIKTIFVTITYKSEVPEDAATNEVYKETKSAVLNLSTKSTLIDVPITSKNSRFIVLIVLSLIVITSFLLKTYKYKHISIILLLLILPMVVFAAEKLELKIVSNAVIEIKQATLKPGPEINVIFKQLAGDGDIDYTFYDENVKDFKRSFTRPSEGVETKVISTDDSGYEVIAWFSEGTIYWYSDANKVYLNADASRMFDRLSTAESIEVKYFDTSRATTLFCFFQSNLALKALDLTTFNTSNVTNFGSFLNRNHSLTSLKGIEDFDVSNATDFHSMFANCYSLKELHLEKWTTSKAEDMHDMFHNCVLLEELDLNNWDVSHVKYMYRMFNASNDNPIQTWGNLKILKIDKWDMSSVEVMIWFLDTQTGITTEFTINNPNITNYNGMFNQAADAGGQVTVNYTRETEALVDSMIASKSAGANVVKGRCVDCEG